MSTESIETLIAEAHFYADYFENKLPADLIYQDIKANDYDNLRVHVKQAKDLAFELEYQPTERLMTDVY